MQEKFFSIIVVSFNPGEGLRATLESILTQTFQDMEVILKDAGSTDGSIEQLEEEGFFGAHPLIRLVRQPDTGIYDGMNQALSLAEGRFLYFLNCGDYLAEDTVLEQAAAKIQELSRTEKGEETGIYYGDQYNRREASLVASAPRINDFTCYRNVPCHQVCFYGRDLFSQRGYDLHYRVRADYEHFLYCIYERKASAVYLGITIASYEGGGFSETKENRRCSAKEHKEIACRYLGRGKVWKYGIILLLTLAPVRTRIARTPILAAGYNRFKQWIYKGLGRS